MESQSPMEESIGTERTARHTGLFRIPTLHVGTEERVRRLVHSFVSLPNSPRELQPVRFSEGPTIGMPKGHRPLPCHTTPGRSASG